MTKTVPQVDQILRRMHAFIDHAGDRPKASMRLSVEDVRWLAAEIEAGREAFGQIAQEKQDLKLQNDQLQLSIRMLNINRPQKER